MKGKSYTLSLSESSVASARSRPLILQRREVPGHCARLDKKGVKKRKADLSKGHITEPPGVAAAKGKTVSSRRKSKARGV